MIRVGVFYPNSEGAKFDMGYYLQKHLPMVKQKVGEALKSVTVEQGVSGGIPGSPMTYIAIGHLVFDSVEAFQASFFPHSGEITADVSNYTNVQPVVQISEVKM
jgi:uncharacterized protein (TIGR02118 family)